MSGDDIVLPDSAAREHALDPERSFIVQAPAGSGKTELLVRRFARLLGTVQRPEEVLAITFTRKAAAEMKKRVMIHLTADDRDGEGGKHGAAELAPRLRIMTIDSLCSSLTRQLPVLARFGAQPGIAEREEADALVRIASEQAAQRAEQEFLEQEMQKVVVKSLEDGGSIKALELTASPVIGSAELMKKQASQMQV